MPNILSVLGQFWMICLALLTATAYIIGFLLLVYLLRIARWYVRKNDIPWRLGKKKESPGTDKEG